MDLVDGIGQQTTAPVLKTMYFATVAGNLALTMGARGGIYIGGGIVPRVIDFFAASSFRERFERHGRLTDYLRRIPTYVIDTAYPAFTGAVVALDPVYDNVGVVSHEAR